MFSTWHVEDDVVVEDAQRNSQNGHCSSNIPSSWLFFVAGKAIKLERCKRNMAVQTAERLLLERVARPGAGAAKTSEP